jgi:excisionase family DNA binding protein
MDEKLLTLAEVSEILKVTMWTLRQWDANGKLPALRTSGGHRRYRESDINQFLGVDAAAEVRQEAVAVYCRVSSNEQKQKGDLDRQKSRVLEYAVKQHYSVEHVISEVGSGMSDSRPKLKRLFELVCGKKITKVLVEHKDRLCRFNFGVYKAFFESHGVEIECMEEVLPKSYEAELVEDMISLMSSFSAKIYGKRSAERRKERHLKVV